MKRISLAFGLIVLGIIGGRLSFAQQPLPSPIPQDQPSPAPVSRNQPIATVVEVLPASPATDDVVSNMIAILNETKSPDTFIVTISTLMVLKDAGKLKNPNLAQVLPAIIRNAERLGLWKGMIEENEITGTMMQKSILECMQRLIQNSQGSNSSARSAPDCGNGRCLPPQLIPITPPSNGESRSSGPAQQPSLPAPAISN